MAALDLLGRRWALRIIWELHHGPTGFRELQRRCEHMSSSVLSARLNELTEARLVLAAADGYQLSRLGQNLIDALLPLQAWSEQWDQALRD